MKKIDFKDIKPKKGGVADFFSWQLYRWVKHRPDACEVWSFDGLLFIGWTEFYGNLLYLYGRRLTELCLAGKRLHSYSFCLPSDAQNVTELFWEQYFKIGVCAIHGDSAHKWASAGPNDRKCENCGKVETKHIRIKEVEVWI